MVYNSYAQSITDINHAALYSIMPEYTNVRLRTATRDRLKAIGIKGEDYDHIVNRLIDKHEGTAEAAPTH